MKKTILITGSTDGIGKLAALKLAKDGHTIYLHGRNEEKLSSTISKIEKETGSKNIKGFLSDFSDLNSVKNMAEQIMDETDSLDVLINNAGIYKSPKSITNIGLELRYVVNYFAPFLLTNKLIPLLEKGNEPRIINLSSAAQSPIFYEVMNGKEESSANEAYAQSKLALTMWSFYLAKELKNISVIALNPGSLLNTKMAIEAFGKFWSDADKGADKIYDLAVSEKYKNLTGKYFDNDRGDFIQAHLDAYDESKITKLIETTTKILTDKNMIK